MYQIRKIQNYTTYLCSDVVTLDPEKFRDLSYPYKGETEEDFLNYINGLDDDIIYDLLKELDKETMEQFKLITPDYINWKEYYNSNWDEDNSQFQIGEKDETYRKTGGFNPNSHFLLQIQINEQRSFVFFNILVYDSKKLFKMKKIIYKYKIRINE